MKHCTAVDVEVLTLQPGESLVYQFKADYSGIWMLSFAKPGMYVMVTHKFADASQGALGVFKVG